MASVWQALDNEGSGTTSGRSSLIGVAISLSGNVLISLALNCQKLAHIRLQQQAQESQGRTGAFQNGKDSRSQGQSEQGQTASDSLLNAQQGGRGSRYGATQSGSDRRGTASPASTSSGHKHQRGQSDDVERDAQGDEQGTKQRDQVQEQSSSGSRFSTDFLKSKLWWLGIGLMTLGEFGNFLSYGFAPASLVAPLGAVALLANVIFSPILLKERFRLSDLGGILLAILGAVTVVFSSKQSDASLDPQQLWEAIQRTEFEAYAGTTAGLAALLCWASATRWGDQYILIDVGVCALFGGFTVLSTKGLSSLVSQKGPFEIVRYPITYGLAVVLISTAVVQITYLNRALQRFDSREVIPTQFVMFTISAIVGSAILYQDFKDTEVHQVVNFLFGCATTFLGVFVLTRSKDDEDEDHYRDEEDGQDHDADLEEEELDDTFDSSADSQQAPLLHKTAVTQGVRIGDERRSPRPAQRHRFTTSSHASVPMTMPDGRTASPARGLGAALLGRSPRRGERRHVHATQSGSAVPTVGFLRTDHARGQSDTPSAGQLPTELGASPRSVPTLYTRRSFFNPTFHITYPDPTYSSGNAVTGAPAAASPQRSGAVRAAGGPVAGNSAGRLSIPAVDAGVPPAGNASSSEERTT